MSTYIIFSLIVILFLLVVFKLIKDKKKGKCCGCGNNNGCNSCTLQDK